VLVGAGKNEVNKHSGKNEALEFIEKFVNTKRNYPYNVKFDVFDKDSCKQDTLEMLIDYTTKYLDSANRDIDVEIPDIFGDGRSASSKTNAKKDYGDIVKLFTDAQATYLKDNPNKSKLSLRIAEKLLNIPMKTIDRALKG